jgi:hypothetical protein
MIKFKFKIPTFPPDPGPDYFSINVANWSDSYMTTGSLITNINISFRDNELRMGDSDYNTKVLGKLYSGDLIELELSNINWTTGSCDYLFKNGTTENQGSHGLRDPSYKVEGWHLKTQTNNTNVDWEVHLDDLETY